MSRVHTYDSYVRVRIDAVTKERAAGALAEMGLSLSDAIRMLLIQVADTKRLPFEVKVPNEETRQAIAELEAGKGYKANSVEEMMAMLDADE
jgi:DNA-damage-inducible protein J